MTKSMIQATYQPVRHCDWTDLVTVVLLLLWACVGRIETAVLIVLMTVIVGMDRRLFFLRTPQPGARAFNVVEFASEQGRRCGR